MDLGSLYSPGIAGLTRGRALRWVTYQVLIWSLLGLVFMLGSSILVALAIAHRPGALLQQLLIQHLGLILAVAIAYAVAVIVIEKTSRFPGWSSIAVVLPAVSAVFLILVCALLVGRFYYSRSFLLSAYCVSLIWLMIGMYLRRHYLVPRLALVPEGVATQLAALHSVHWRVLVGPSLAGAQVDGVVVDLHSKLPDPWLRFVADCALHRIPVYSARRVYESVTGRASLGQLSEGLMGDLEPPAMYLPAKRLFDTLGVVAAAPFLLLLMVVIAVSIKLDTRGPVFFIQDRVGRGGRIFRIVKFRSMYVESECGEARFADRGDPRVTRVGAVLRKWRLDELPQVVNVLLGQMSLVGPRPEQVGFVEYFESQIPFYGYRHIVRPGITGWAQVTHGYTSDLASTTEKLERDIYYIRHLSFWLDFAILVRTARILVTGFGAR